MIDMTSVAPLRPSLVRRVAGPDSDPIDIDRAKLWMRITSDVEINTIQDLIKAATELLDGWNGRLNPKRCLVSQTWEAVYDGFPTGWIDLPLVPVISVASVIYIDGAGDPQTIDAGGYTLLADEWSAKLVLPDGGTWPTPLAGSGTVTVNFVAGYAEIPAKLRQDLLTLVGYWFTNRDKVGQMPDGWSSVYKRPVLA